MENMGIVLNQFVCFYFMYGGVYCDKYKYFDFGFCQSQIEDLEEIKCNFSVEWCWRV